MHCDVVRGTTIDIGEGPLYYLGNNYTAMTDAITQWEADAGSKVVDGKGQGHCD